MVYMTFVFLESKGEHKRFCTGSQQEFPQIILVSVSSCMRFSFVSVFRDCFNWHFQRIY